MDVAVENQTDQFPRPVHHRAAGVAADDVGGRDEIEWGPHKGLVAAQLILLLSPAGRQIEGGRLPLGVDPVEQPRIGGEGSDRLAALLVALHGAEGEPQCERGIGIHARPTLGKLCLHDLSMRLPLDLTAALHCLPEAAGLGIHQRRQSHHRIPCRLDALPAPFFPRGRELLSSVFNRGLASLRSPVPQFRAAHQFCRPLPGRFP